MLGEDHMRKKIKIEQNDMLNKQYLLEGLSLKIDLNRIIPKKIMLFPPLYKGIIETWGNIMCLFFSLCQKGNYLENIM
jgi:hypothetical protein